MKNTRRDELIYPFGEKKRRDLALISNWIGTNEGREKWKMIRIDKKYLNIAFSITSR